MSDLLKINNNVSGMLDPFAKSLLRSTVMAASNLFYELVFMVNAASDVIEFVSMSSGLAKRVLDSRRPVYTFHFLVETISGSDVMMIDKIVNHIRLRVAESPSQNRSNLLFMTDLQYILNDRDKNFATYKFAPLTQGEDGVPIHFLCSVGFSSRKYQEKILQLDVNTGARAFLGSNGVWCKSEYDKLTPVELSVLALSAEGRTIPEIAEVINKATDSVKSIRKRIFVKLQVRNISEAIVFAMNHKLV